MVLMVTFATLPNTASANTTTTSAQKQQLIQLLTQMIQLLQLQLATIQSESPSDENIQNQSEFSPAVVTSIESKANAAGVLRSGDRAFIHGEGLSGFLTIKIGAREPKIVTARGVSDTYAEFIVPYYSQNVSVSITVTNESGVTSNFYNATIKAEGNSESGPTVVSPNGGEELMAEKGAFIAQWRSNDRKVDLYLMSLDGSSRLEKLGSNLQSNSLEIQLEEKHLQKNVNRYRIQVCTAGTQTRCDISDESFAFVARSNENEEIDPMISRISPSQSSGKNVDLITIYGENLGSKGEGKGGDLSVTLTPVRGEKVVLELKSTDSPMTILTGVYLTPPDSTGTHMQARIDVTSLKAGFYALGVMVDGRESNTVIFEVR